MHFTIALRTDQPTDGQKDMHLTEKSGRLTDSGPKEETEKPRNQERTGKELEKESTDGRKERKKGKITGKM